MTEIADNTNDISGYDECEYVSYAVQCSTVHYAMLCSAVQCSAVQCKSEAGLDRTGQGWTGQGRYACNSTIQEMYEYGAERTMNVQCKYRTVYRIYHFTGIRPKTVIISTPQSCHFGASHSGNRVERFTVFDV